MSTFDEKEQNLPTLDNSYKVIRGTTILLTRYYENVDLFLHFKKFGSRLIKKKILPFLD